jgi:hypothetical protein
MIRVMLCQASSIATHPSGVITRYWNIQRKILASGKSLPMLLAPQLLQP